MVGSWLLPAETLTHNEDFGDALKTFMGDAGARFYMVSGKGVWDAVPRGGSDAVNPAWRKALIHAGELSSLTCKYLKVFSNTYTVTSQSWKSLNQTAQAETMYSINEVQTEALRQLVPESGAYINEVWFITTTHNVCL